MEPAQLLSYLDQALTARADLFDDRHESALRLFNGFYEGCPDLAIDLYGRTAVLHNYASDPAEGMLLATAAEGYLLERLPWLQAVVLKTRNGESDQAKQGQLTHGRTADHWIREHGVRYAIDLTMNQDASLYLDTRQVRRWALDHLAGQTVLNTFAYTGSLGVAAMAAGAQRVVHTDLNKRFLNVAKTSYTLNGFPIDKKEFQVGDFWSHMNRLKRAGERFDCVFLDPPFFSQTEQGTVDLTENMTRLINKVRPLVNHNGRIVAINNALFVSGRDYMAELEALCADGYVEIEQLLPVPADFTGYANTTILDPITDPAPFNHSTKIAILTIYHRQS